MHSASKLHEAMSYSADKHGLYARAEMSQNEPKTKDNYTAGVRAPLRLLFKS